jgi:hypothetical protein
MRTERYKRIENAIAASDSGGIWERWRYGRRLLCDAEATTPKGNLQHHVLDKLIRAAARGGRKLSEREIQRRVQVARTYPCESQIRQLLTDFGTWDEVINGGFPVYEAAEGERPYNPLETDELVSQNDNRGRRLIEYSWYSNTLFDHLDPETTTLAEMRQYAEEQDEITARFAAAGQKRWLMLDELTKAVHGDLSKTWAEAENALTGGIDA